MQQSPALLALSPRMVELRALVERFAKTPLPVLVLGETGVGKELVSRALHEQSDRRRGPLVVVNCAAIPRTLIESVLFGHERGAFTGAAERRPGVFEQSSGGSVFLDEVGELDPSVQATLLRVLESKKVTRVGGCQELDVDVRVIAATHRDLHAMAAAGTFRMDLLFRLDALSVSVPPLRERIEEVGPLCERFLARAVQQWDLGSRRITAEARAALCAHAWPGNVRELKNVVERAALLCTGEEIGLAELPPAVRSARPTSPVLDRSAPVERPASCVRARSLPKRVAAFEEQLIREALAATAGNHTRAAQLLEIPRRTLSNKIVALGLAHAGDAEGARSCALRSSRLRPG